MNRGSNSGCPEINGISFMRLSVLTIHYIFKDPLRHDSKKKLTVHSKKNWCYISLKVIFLARNHWGTTFGAV